MDDYLSKPVKSEDLDAVLGCWIPPHARETKPQSSDSNRSNGLADRGSIDHSALERLRDLQQEGEPDILAELVELFIDDVPPWLKTLRRAVKEGDEGSIERVARALKGSCENMGVSRMAGICADLQEIGRSGNLPRAPELLGKLEAEFDHVGPELNQKQR